VPGSRPGWPGCLATRASSPGYVNNKAEHTAETRAVRQLPEGHRTEIRAAASSLYTTLRGVGGGPDAVRRQVIQLAAGFARTREEGRGRRDSEPVPGELAFGASGLLALRLVAATSAHAWRSGPCSADCGRGAQDDRDKGFYEPPHEVGHNRPLSGWATRPDAFAFRVRRPGQRVARPRDPTGGMGSRGRLRGSPRMGKTRRNGRWGTASVPPISQRLIGWSPRSWIRSSRP